MGKTVIERQIEMYRRCGIDHIIVVRGFAADKIKYEGVTYYTNEEYANTNMVESLMAAETEFDDDMIVSYSDILFEEKMLKAMMNSEIGFGRKVLQAFEDYGISFEHVPSGIDTMTVFVHQDEFIDKEQKVVSAIHRLADPDSIDIEADLALVAVVGRGMKSTRGTAGRIFSALAHANVNVKMIDQGSSELNIIIGVANEDFEDAIKAIYDIFVVSQL